MEPLSDQVVGLELTASTTCERRRLVVVFRLGVQGASRPRTGPSPPELLLDRSEVTIAEPPLPDASGPRAH